MLNRLRCLLNGHAWTDWSAWTHGGRAKFYRERHCPRCQAHQTDIDG
jgi:hypothetical protein